MKDSDHTHHWSEADVDSLLTEFFRAELPAELRQASNIDSPQRPQSTVRATRQRERSAGFKGLGAAACAMVLAVVAFSTAGRNLLTSRPAAPKETPAVTAKDATGAGAVVAQRHPTVTPPPELMKVIPPELRPPHENTAPVNVGASDPLDLRDLLRIEIFEPRDASKRPRVPERRPRLPEER